MPRGSNEFTTMKGFCDDFSVDRDSSYEMNVECKELDDSMIVEKGIVSGAKETARRGLEYVRDIPSKIRSRNWDKAYERAGKKVPNKAISRGALYDEAAKEYKRISRNQQIGAGVAGGTAIGVGGYALGKHSKSKQLKELDDSMIVEKGLTFGGAKEAATALARNRKVRFGQKLGLSDRQREAFREFKKRRQIESEMGHVRRTNKKAKADTEMKRFYESGPHTNPEGFPRSDIINPGREYGGFPPRSVPDLGAKNIDIVPRYKRKKGLEENIIEKGSIIPNMASRGMKVMAGSMRDRRKQMQLAREGAERIAGANASAKMTALRKRHGGGVVGKGIGTMLEKLGGRQFASAAERNAASDSAAATARSIRAAMSVPAKKRGRNPWDELRKLHK